REVSWARRCLLETGIRIERGGDITFHGPGQAILYPIIDLEHRSLGVKNYVSILEESVIELLKGFGIKGERVEGATGVWIGKDTESERKICAIGVKISRSVTMHGLALNINTNLDAFSAINPCGFVNKGVTSMQKELGKEVDMHMVKEKLLYHFLRLIDK
ncbi:MAG: lipoyl(octanoyl) transferase LipB, partial [Muribaculaceae bacterium]|nr:lipoyl(octanoyl) transferase LipB [Muribaculaceae bacterium]